MREQIIWDEIRRKKNETRRMRIEERYLGMEKGKRNNNKNGIRVKKKGKWRNENNTG